MEKEIKPWLMYFTGNNNLNFWNISDSTKSFSRRIPDQWRKSDLELCTVQHGWFLWENKNMLYSNFFLWNPLNLKKIMLPPLNNNNYTSCFNFILSSPPTMIDETCSIFLLSSHCLSIFYCHLGDKQWTKLCSYDDFVRELAVKGISNAPLMGKNSFFKDSVYCNGCLYARMKTSLGFIIVVIEKLQPNGFSINWIYDFMLKRIPTFSGGFDQIISNLIGLDNVLFGIEVLHAQDRVVAVFVYEFDYSQRVWIKAENIKDKVFFISSHDSAFACQAINPETEGGRIYIALNNCNFVYIYNIEGKSLVTCQLLSKLSKTRTFSICFMPKTRMTRPNKEKIGKGHQVRQREGIYELVHSKDEKNEAHNGLLSIPQDVIEVIAKRINNVLDYLHFRASNKFHCLAAPPIQWRSSSSTSMSRFDDLSMCPLFAFSEKDKVFTFVHPKHGLRYKNIIKFPQDLHQNMNLEICYSKEGWLLLVAVHQSYQVFFNPFTKEVLPLPLGNKKIRNIRCFGMSHSPTSHDECVTVELVKRNYSMTIYLHHLSTGQCRLIECEDKKIPLFNTSPVIHDLKYYFLSVTGKLAVITIEGNNPIWKVFEEPKTPCSNYFNNYLVECDGHLLSVFESEFAKEIQVFKLNESTMKWMKVESLKNHMLFVGKTSFSAVANIPGMENKIYFNRFYDDSVVFYSLETNNYHTFKNDEVVNFHHVKEQLNGTWIQSKWHRV